MICHESIKLKPVKWSTKSQMVSCSQQQTTREVEIKKFITHKS